MFRRPQVWWLLASIALGALAAAGAPAAARNPSGRDPEAVASIVGGQPASIAEFPSLAFITGGDGLGAFSCSGTVVAPRVVLTAGHCVDNIGSLAEWKASDYATTTGIANVSHPRPSNRSSVVRTVTYPGFNPSNLTGDAGLLVLSKPVSVPAISLASPSAPGPLAAETPLTIAGWGVTSADGSDTPAVLQKGEVRVQPPTACEKVDIFKSAALQLCGVDVPRHEATACFGDSGGPAIARAWDGTLVEVGITSDSECIGRLPTVFTRVDQVAEWVHGWIDTVETGAPEPTLPRAHLPALRMSEAETIILNSLIEGVVSDSHRGVDPTPARGPRQAGRASPGSTGGSGRSCQRLSRAKIRCVERTRRDDGREFFGFTVAYSIEDNAVVVKGHYALREVSCPPRTGKKRRCTVYTQRN